jgi:TRAP-type C4-dicarboxylate transport system substrate-binding protein
MKNSALAAALLAILLLAAPAAFAADETTLIFATTESVGDQNAALVLIPWAKRVTDATNGAGRIDVREGFAIANPSNIYDRVQSDVVQIGLLIPSIVGGKFPLTDVVGLPFLTADSTNASVAYWRLTKTGLLDDEYKDIVPLGVGLFPPQGVHTAKPMASTDNLNGLRLRVVSKTGSESITRLGGTPMVLDPNDQYTALQRGTLDGVVSSWFGMGPLHLTEVTSFHLETSLGTGMFMVFMSRPKYAALPAAIRKAIDDNSGEPLSRALGANFDKQALASRAPAAADPAKHKIVQLTPAQSQKWAATINPVIEAWTASRPNGQKLLDTYRRLIADVTAGR